MKDENNKNPEDEASLDGDGHVDPSDAQADLAFFAVSVGHAFAPRALDDDAHEAILARVLGVAERPADRTEERAAVELRDAFAAGDVSHPLVALAHATRLAANPTVVPELVQERHVRTALKAPSKVVFLRTATMFGVVAAAAAALLILVARPKTVETPSASVDPNAEHMEFLPGMVESRTTTTLFEPEDFPRDGGQRARIDRISNARQADLRQNQFVAWGAE